MGKVSFSQAQPALPAILLVEDTPSLARLYLEYLKLAPVSAQHAANGAQAMQHLRNQPVDVLLLDLNLPDMSGHSILMHCRKHHPDVPVIVITAHGSIAVAVEAMRQGAYDFITKPFRAERLHLAIDNAVRDKAVAGDVRVPLVEQADFHGFIGQSPAMQPVYETIEQAAGSKATIFITGESGTGKEVCAEAIHKCSPRANRPFIALNCSAIPRDLMESEIFGHSKGAFTGAVADRAGAAEQADTGTLFLDEICEMDLALQAKLLRFIQTSSYQKVGASGIETVDVRFLCATNRDPWEEVQAGRFREDLFFRLYVIPLALPPLRARHDDILLLARFFLKRFAAQEHKAFTDFAPDVAAILQAYPWPGNVRQLQNMVHNMVVLHDGNMIVRGMLPAVLLGEEPHLQASTGAGHHKSKPAEYSLLHKPLWLIEKEAIEGMIAECDGNILQAAKRLEINPSTIYRKKQAWEQRLGS